MNIRSKAIYQIVRVSVVHKLHVSHSVRFSCTIFRLFIWISAFFFHFSIARVYLCARRNSMSSSPLYPCRPSHFYPTDSNSHFYLFRLLWWPFITTIPLFSRCNCSFREAQQHQTLCFYVKWPKRFRFIFTAALSLSLLLLFCICLVPVHNCALVKEASRQ